MGNSFRQTVAGIFSDRRMNEDVMLSSHIVATAERAKATEGDYLIAAQDTTFYNYTGHKQMEGLGKLQGGILGILQHNVLLTSDKGVPLGLIDQQYWSRESAVAFDGKESLKWERGLQAVNDRLAATGKKVVVVQDREADIFSFFKYPRESDIELLVRVHQPRNLEVAGSGEVSKLAGLGEMMPLFGQKMVAISREGKEVTLTLSLQACKVHVLPDKDRSARKHKTQELSLVIAREIAASDSKGNDVFNADKAALWYLLTSLPIDNQLDIERVVAFYGLRWRVERLHFTLKSGALNVEKLQFDDIETTINALSFYSVVAWQLLAVTYVLRENQDAPAQSVFEQNEVSLLEKIDKKPIKTVKDAVLALAKIAGFAKSKRQPLPGVKVLAQAFERFHYIKLGNIIDH
jgi:hypothetical protein